MWNKCKGLLQNQQGQGMVEYGLIIAFVAVAALVSVTALGTNISTLFTGISFTK